VSRRPARFKTAPRNTVLLGDAASQLRRLPDDCVDVVITSPPYVGLRRYGAGEAEIGTETSVAAFVERLLMVTEELARVLKDSGSLWLNIADSFSRTRSWGAPRKGMLLSPERLLLGLVDQGWLVRGKIVWHKSNPMPNSVRDRFTATHEMLFHLVRSPNYFFDLDAVRIPHRSAERGLTAPRGHAKAKTGPPASRAKSGTRRSFAGPLANGDNRGLTRLQAEGRAGHARGKNPGDVWTIATAGFRGLHPAVFPERLVERPLLATCPLQVCINCGSPWRQQALRTLGSGCECRATWRPGLVLDPFIGAGTTGLAARRHGYDWLGIELKAAYRSLAMQRIRSAPACDNLTEQAA